MGALSINTRCTHSSAVFFMVALVILVMARRSFAAQLDLSGSDVRGVDNNVVLAANQSTVALAPLVVVATSPTDAPIQWAVISLQRLCPISPIQNYSFSGTPSALSYFINATSPSITLLGFQSTAASYAAAISNFSILASQFPLCTAQLNPSVSATVTLFYPPSSSTTTAPITTAACNNSPQLDVVFVLDSSVSNATAWASTNQFVSNVLSGLSVGSENTR